MRSIGSSEPRLSPALPGLALLAWAAVAGAAEPPGAGQAMGGMVHQPERCEGPPLACARKATPAFGPDGALWLAFSDHSRVHVARSTDRGRTFGPPVALTPVAVRIDAGADYRPQLVVEPSGQVTVGWAEMTDRPFVGELYYARSTDGGRTFGPATALSDGTAGKRFLSLAADPAGGLFAAWIDKRELDAAEAAGREYAGAALAVAWTGPDGATFGNARLVAEHSCECCRVGVDFAGPGQPVVLWRHLFGPARDHAVMSFATPTRPGPLHRVSDDQWNIDACPHHGPSLAVATDGSYHVAWFTDGNQRQGLFYARSTDGGASFTAPLAFGDPARRAGRPQVLAAADGLWLAWRENEGPATVIPVRLSTDGGRTWSAVRIVARSEGVADQPVLIADPAGRAHLSWLTEPEGYRLLPLAGG